MARIVKWLRNGPYAILVEGKNQVFLRLRPVGLAALLRRPPQRHQERSTGQALRVRRRQAASRSTAFPISAPSSS